jgi:tetratricopeptide (TPR) repeat protein
MINNDFEEKRTKIFITTSDLLKSMNKAIESVSAGETENTPAPRFELQKRLPNGYSVKADAADLAAADMESKFSQAAKEIEDLSPVQKLEWSKLQRAEGNRLYATKEYREAIDVYLTCLVIKSNSSEFLNDVFLPIMNNLAQCTLQLGNYRKAQLFCTMALEECDECSSPPNLISKLYFRRGKALRLSGDYTRCIQDLEKAIQMIPLSESNEADHRSIQREMALAKRSHLESKRNEAKQMKSLKNFFDSSEVPQNQALVINKSKTSSCQPGTEALYGSEKSRKTFSTLKAHYNQDKVDEPKTSQKMTYWQYYLAVIGAVAKQLLLWLGDEDTIDEEEWRRHKNA